MQIPELPEEYKTLAKERKTEYGINPSANSLLHAFDWLSTPEPERFWRKCHIASDVSDLPPLPED